MTETGDEALQPTEGALPPPSELLSTFSAAVHACQQALSFRPAGLISDIDGTISPIVLDPSAAFVLPGCRDALAALATQLDLVGVLTGRGAGAARDMLGLESVGYFGTHGMVRWTQSGAQVHPDATPFVPLIGKVLPAVRARLSYDGIVVEEKGPALAVHYRQTLDPVKMRELVLLELAPFADATGMTLFEGRMVVELRPPLPLGKGWSLGEIARGHSLASLVYLGDDRTDIEAFEALGEWREAASGRHGVALAVASPEMPPALRHAADFLLNDVPAVELLLRQLTGMPAQGP